MRRKSAPRKAAVLAAAALLAALLAAGAAGAGGCGGQARTYAPLEAEEFRPLVDAGGTVALSSDQRGIIDGRGYPSHFFISWDPVSGDRVESWTYFPQREEFTFLGGKRLRKEAVEDESAEYPPTSLRPEDFSSALSLEGAEALLGKPFHSSTVEGEKGDVVVILFYGQATLDYTNGRLTGVNTMVHDFGGFPEGLLP